MNGVKTNGTAAHATNGNVPYGARLLPQVADELARTNPNKIYASLARSNDISQGFRHVTIKELVQAVNNVAWWLDAKYGRSDVFETIAIMGTSDIRYTVIFLAAVKCGYKVMVPSVRNSLSMNLSLLDQTSCSKFFYSSEMKSRAFELKDKVSDLECIPYSSFDEMAEGRSEHYPFDKVFAEVEFDPILIVHTSGSTGSPKPITLSHGGFSLWDNHRNIPKTPGRRNQDYSLFNFPGDPNGGKYYTTYPPFHLAGFVNMIVLPIVYESTLVLGPADRPASGQLVSEIMKQLPLRAIMCPPTVLEQLLQEPDGLDQAAKLSFIIYTGGPLSPSAGDRLSQVTDVCQLYGSTETGVIAAYVPLRENWMWFEFQPVYGNKMEHVDEDIYEMVIPRDMSLKWIRGICHQFPEVAEWRTRDLFKKHPSKPNLWRFHGRRDDILVLGTGEKFNPVPMEQIIQGHPLLSGALIVGLARFQAALLVEPKSAISDKDAFIDEIWPYVHKANVEGPAHAKIVRSKIAIASPEKPFVRAGKGTVVRGQTTKAYADEIEELYSEKGAAVRQGIPDLDAPKDFDALKQYIHKFVNVLLPKGNVGDQDDFYNLGLDSLQTVELANGLRAGLTHAADLDLSIISIRTIYANPTVERLSKAIHNHFTSNSQSPPQATDGESEEDRVERMSAIVNKYTHDLPKIIASTKTVSANGKLNIVLTGSTGSLGTNILQTLLDDPEVDTVYCLNRSANARERHEKNFASRGVEYSIDSPKVEFLKVDFGHAHYGLPKYIYDGLVHNVDVIIHNAWKVNFNHQLESFEDTHIRGVRNFVDWSIASPRHPHIVFVSSISSVGNWAAAGEGDGAVTEAPLTNYNVAQKLGYGESKHVSERILSIAAERSGVPTSMLRVGQIAGPLAANGGEWNKTEWLPCLVKTSKSLRRIPSSLSAIDWIPVDELASIIREIAHSDTPQIYNLVNPKTTDWASLVPTIQNYFAEPTTVAIPLADWVDLLQSLDASDKQELETKPALKILDFFEGLERASAKEKLAYDTTHGRTTSRTMAELAPVSPEAMEVWLDQWKF
ncbi:MAG: putative NRPS-like protein biosynthetic cluster [Pycnora praestabilis]|nr:MAG: putative NRPS-like protein biosynthetic cluster [Pycnora praestabilis]